MASLMRSLGYSSVRMWNDDVLRSGDTNWNRAAELDRDIEIEYWTPSANGGKNTVRTYIDEGYRVYNFINYYTYYVLGFGMKSKITPEQLSSEWNAYSFGTPEKQDRVEPSDTSVLGGGFCVWCDNPSAESAEDILKHISPYLFSAGEAML